jgi:hypothetical protein
MPYKGPLSTASRTIGKTYRAVVHMSIKTQTCLVTLRTAATCGYLA